MRDIVELYSGQVRSTSLRLILTARKSILWPTPHEWFLIVVLLFFTDRYRWMMDDAFIYFRYIDNLVFLGRGLVFNPEEYVEGFTSPAWIFLLLLFRAFGVDYYAIVRALALTIAFSYGIALIWVNRQLSPCRTQADCDGLKACVSEKGRSLVCNVPLAASAAHYGVASHFSSGLETPLVQLLAPLFVAALLRPRAIWLQCVVAIAPLIRAECALLCVLYFGFVVIRTRSVPYWLIGFGLGANGGWLLFRVIYFADFLPNTFYLKDTSQWSLGWMYWINVESTHHLLWWLLGLCACAFWGHRWLRAESAVRATICAAGLLYGLYVTRVGGDMLYYRYAVLPLCLGLCASAGFLEAALVALDERSGYRLAPFAAPTVAVIICVAYGLCYPPQLATHPFGLPRGSRKWGTIADPNWHRRHAQLEYSDERRVENELQLADYARLRSTGGLTSTKIVAEGLCVAAFRAIDVIVVHDFGLTDPVLARLPRAFGRPGHKLVQVEAGDLVRLKRAARKKGAVWYELPNAPRWVQDNRAVLAILEQKLHNQHIFTRNLELASMRLKLK
jgi:hypothetical protein